MIILVRPAQNLPTKNLVLHEPFGKLTIVSFDKKKMGIFIGELIVAVEKKM